MAGSNGDEKRSDIAYPSPDYPSKTAKGLCGGEDVPKSLGLSSLLPINFPSPKKLGIELGSALGAAVAVSPLVAIIDSAIYKNASGSQTLVRSLASGAREFVLNPVSYFRTTPVLIMFGVYGVTYTTANLVDGFAAANRFDSVYPKMACTSIINVAACVFKDVIYTRMYGTSAGSRIPKSSLALYFGRDILTLCATFGFPDLVAASLGRHGIDPAAAKALSQISIPCTVQLVTTPLHLLGINLYNCPEASIRDRFKFLRSEYVNNTVVKALRVFFAFGIGGIANTRLRNYGYSLVEE